MVSPPPDASPDREQKSRRPVVLVFRSHERTMRRFAGTDNALAVICG